ncbi:MAG: hypothetical protein U0974_14060 [Gemmatimonadales bacterium]|nr:hypothetical protein [Gemmatimonadales bacterium]MDZ4390840.1 hypothetical protein [Gemmatimonadales bacterium]
MLAILIVGMIACHLGETTAPTESEWVLERIAVGTDDAVDMGRPLIVRSGPDGLLYVATQRMSGLAMVLDSSANLVRTLGARGEGPGEFNYVAQLYPKGDSVVVGDLRGTAALFAADGRFVRALASSINVIGQVVLLRGDTLLVPMSIMNEERFGLPLHLMAPNGDTVRSFGAEDRSYNPRLTVAAYRIVAPQTDSTFWVARIDRYQIERWHINGQLLQEITLERSWFSPRTEDWDGSQSERPPSRIKQIHQDRDGHLMVLLERARADWQPERGAVKGQEPSGPSSLPEQMRYFEHLIEILDPTNGTLLATVSGGDTYLMNFVDDDRLVGIQSGPDGEEWPTIYRVTHAATPQ